MTEKLNMDYINRLPQPFIAHFYGGSEWPVQDIEVQTGLLRIDVVGMLDVKHISEVKFFRDMDGTEHDADSFYSDYEPTPNMILTNSRECGIEDYMKPKFIETEKELIYDGCELSEVELQILRRIANSHSLDDWVSLGFTEEEGLTIIRWWDCL